jgi:hypothetical protein
MKSAGRKRLSVQYREQLPDGRGIYQIAGRKDKQFIARGR